jgi:hypothetical protein
MNGKRTLWTLIVMGLIALAAGTGCTETQVAAEAQPAATTPVLPLSAQPPLGTPTPVVIVVVVTPTPQPSAQPPGGTELPGAQPSLGTPTLRAEPQGEAGVASTPSAQPSLGAPAPTVSSPTARMTAPAGNLRSGPGVAYPVVGQASQGDELAVLNRNQAGDWLQVTWKGNPAWLSASLVSLNVKPAELAVAPAVAPPPSAQPPIGTATAAPAATPTPVAKATTPYCDSVPIRGFGKVWGDRPEVAALLGCPGWPPNEQGTDAAVQPFEHGLMLWLGADSHAYSDPVYVLFEGGQYQRFADQGAADPAVVGEIPAGFYAPGDHFGKVYWEGTGARVKERLGYATGPQVSSPGAFQQFWNGRMFWTGTLDRIFVLYDYWRYDKNGQNGVQVRAWTSFEDTFGK